MHRLSIITVIFAMTMMLISCSSLQPNYPDAWPRLISTNVNIATSLEGFYECMGEVVTGRPAPDSTKDPLIKDDATRFLFEKIEQPKNCSVVSLRTKNDGAIEITAYNGDDIFERRTIQKDVNYTVENNWMNLEKTHDVESGGGVILDSSTIQNSLTVSENGDLIVKSKTYGFGVVYFVPYGNDDYYWVRFRRLSP